MYKPLLLSFLTVLTITAASAQERQCFTDERYREILAKDPAVRAVREQLEDFTRQFIQSRQQRQGGAHVTSSVPPYIIPVVFHIVHQYGPENIPDAAVIDCINQMNADFRKLNSDTNQIIGPYLNIADDCKIEFRLATRDPNGNCTNGIDRIYSHFLHTPSSVARYA